MSEASFALISRVGRNVSAASQLCYRKRNPREERDSLGQGHAV